MTNYTSLSATSGIEVFELRDSADPQQRGPRSRDPAAWEEGEARLAHALLERPETLLQELADTMVSLCGGDSAGISIERPDRTEEQFYHWVATAGQYAGFLNRVLPRNPSACGVCLALRRPLGFRVLPPFFDLMGIPAPTVTDGILLPWYGEGLQGTLWVMTHGRDAAFDVDDVKLLRVFVGFALQGIKHQRRWLSPHE